MSFTLVVLVPSFELLYHILLLNIVQCTCLFFCWWTLKLLPFFTIINSAAKNNLMCASSCTGQRPSLGYRSAKVEWEILLHPDLSSNSYTNNVYETSFFFILPICWLWDSIFRIAKEIEQLFIYLIFRFPPLWICFLIYFAHWGAFVFFLLNYKNIFTYFRY